jgi:hypothetical protein
VIFEAKLKDIKLNTTPAIITCILGSILLNQQYVLASGISQEGSQVASYLSKLAPPTLLTAMEIYKVKAYIRMYITNSRLYLHESSIST